MRVDAFDFELPSNRIADRPVSPRDAARLLVVGDELGDYCFRDLPRLLRRGDILVVNNTKVIPARLFGRRGDVPIEATLIRQVREKEWLALARPARRLRPDDVIDFAEGFEARVLGRDDGAVRLRFSLEGAAFDRALADHGAMPLPPYIARPEGGIARDRADYQTMFAAVPGAVAAPTAGLHFTPRVESALRDAGIDMVEITLHVGPGTFAPVRVEETCELTMAGEHGELSADVASALNEARTSGGRIVAVGSTSARMLETCCDASGTIAPFSGETSLFITPGHRFRAVDLMISNFHLPRSTLFMLVAAFAGLDRIHAAYAHAIRAGYRFYSYGDACLLHPAGA